MSAGSLLCGGRARSRDGTGIGYLTLGPGTGRVPTVLCTHGAFATGAGWLPVARSLADRFRLVLMDRRGHGGSGGARESVGGPLALRQEREDLEAVLAAVQPAGHTAPVVLLGHSVGACTALAACLAPDGPRFDRIVAVEPPLVQDVTEADLARFREMLAAGRYEDAVVWGFRDVQKLVPQGLERMRRSGRAWAEIVAAAPMMLRHWELALALPPPERFAALDTPTLLLHGSRSDERPFVHSTRVLAGVLPAARLDVVDGHHHASLTRDPEPVAARIRKFLDEEAL